MPNQEDYVDEAYESNEEYQTEDYQDGEEAPQVDSTLEEIKSLKDQIRDLQASLVARNTPQKTEEPDLSDDQYAAIAQDPKLMGQFLKAFTQKQKTELTTQANKLHYDKLAEERFPAIVTSEVVKKKVIAKMQELVISGEYRPDSPTLTLRAAEMVVPTLGSSVLETKKRQNADVMDASTTGVHRSKAMRSKIADNDPRIQFLKLYGITDPKKIEKFKAGLEPYQPTQRKRGRSLMK